MRIRGGVLSLAFLLLFSAITVGAETLMCPFDVFPDLDEAAQPIPGTFNRVMVLNRPALLSALRSAMSLSGRDQPWSDEHEVGGVTRTSANVVRLTLRYSTLPVLLQSDIIAAGCSVIPDNTPATPARTPRISGETLVYDREDSARSIVNPVRVGAPPNRTASLWHWFTPRLAWALTDGPEATSLVIEDCNRVEAPLSNGGQWTSEIDTDDLAGLESDGTNCFNDGGNPSSAWWNAANFGPDVEVYWTQSDATHTGAGNQEGFIRLADAGTATPDAYLCRFREEPAPTDDTLTIQRMDDGVRTQLGATITQEIADGEKFLCRIVGSGLTLNRFSGGSWAVMHTASDSTYSAAGRVGWLGTTNNIKMDDLGAGTITATARRSLGFHLLRNR